MKRHFASLAALGFSIMIGTAAVAETAEVHWPAGAKVFFIAPEDGAVIAGPVKVVMGVKGIEIAPAGSSDKPHTGHHHILIDTPLPTGENALAPLPANDQIKHFGKGQTETELTLAPGKHTLQLVVGDSNHIPHDPVLASDQITITVK